MVKFAFINLPYTSTLENCVLEDEVKNEGKEVMNCCIRWQNHFLSIIPVQTDNS